MKIKKLKKKKKTILKKFLLSSLAAFSLVAIFDILNLECNGNTSLVNSTNSTKNADTATYISAPLQTNDIYDDYAYANGFVSISGSVINFYDWFGFKSWSYDVNANAGNLFGNSSLKISTLKVKSSTDGNSMYVYGYFSNNSSYLFALNTADGSVSSLFSLNAGDSGLISPTAGKKAYTSNDGLIQNANLLTIVNGYIILTQKQPVILENSTTIYTSEINLSTGFITNNTYDMSNLSSARSLYVIQWGQIVGVQKVSARIVFEITCVRSNGGDTTKSTPSLIYAYFVSGSLNAASSNAMGWWTSGNQSLIDLDKVSLCTVSITNSDGSVSTYFAPKYDTTSTTVGYPGTSSGSTTTPTQIYYSNANTIACSTLTSTSFAVKAFNVTSVNGSNDKVIGVTNFLFNKGSNSAYAVLADGNSTTKLAISSLNNTTASVAPGWIDLTSFGVKENANQVLSLWFIPSTSNGTTISGGYAGYLNIETQSNFSTFDLTDSSAFLSLNSTGTTITPLNLEFTYALSDSDISNKYGNGKYKANDTTKNSLINDLTQINLNGNIYKGVTYTSTIAADPSTNTLKGNVVLTINNWWNSSTSQLTRTVNINLNGNTITSGGSVGSADTATARSVNVMMYSAICLIVLVIIAFLLVLIKVLTKKKSVEILIENESK